MRQDGSGACNFVRSRRTRYKCAHGFVSVRYEEATGLVQKEIALLQTRIADLRTKLLQDEERAAILKKVLHSKFGDSIQLEL